MLNKLSIFIAVAGSLLIAPAALAQVAAIQSIESFPLEIQPPYKTFEASQPSVVTLATNQAVAITASTPVSSGFSDPFGTQLTSYIRHDDVEVTQGNPLNINTVGEVQINVRMRASRPVSYPVGEYLYTVTLTIAPQ